MKCYHLFDSMNLVRKVPTRGWKTVWFCVCLFLWEPSHQKCLDKNNSEWIKCHCSVLERIVMKSQSLKCLSLMLLLCDTHMSMFQLSGASDRKFANNNSFQTATENEQMFYVKCSSSKARSSGFKWVISLNCLYDETVLVVFDTFSW